MPYRACCSLFQAAWDMCQMPEKKRTGAGAGRERVERASSRFSVEGRGDCGGDGGGDGGKRPREARVWAEACVRPQKMLKSTGVRSHPGWTHALVPAGAMGLSCEI